ncbi:MAG: hypothetical protein AAF579_16705 [Cyanobacteria bacterium P01_C01_bin.118]
MAVVQVPIFLDFYQVLLQDVDDRASAAPFFMEFYSHLLLL